MIERPPCAVYIQLEHRRFRAEPHGHPATDDHSPVKIHVRLIFGNDFRGRFVEPSIFQILVPVADHALDLLGAIIADHAMVVEQGEAQLHHAVPEVDGQTTVDQKFPIVGQGDRARDIREQLAQTDCHELGDLGESQISETITPDLGAAAGIELKFLFRADCMNRRGVVQIHQSLAELILRLPCELLNSRPLVEQNSAAGRA